MMEARPPPCLPFIAGTCHALSPSFNVGSRMPHRHNLRGGGAHSLTCSPVTATALPWGHNLPMSEVTYRQHFSSALPAMYLCSLPTVPTPDRVTVPMARTGVTGPEARGMDAGWQQGHVQEAAKERKKGRKDKKKEKQKEEAKEKERERARERAEERRKNRSREGRRKGRGKGESRVLLEPSLPVSCPPQETCNPSMSSPSRCS